MRNLVCAFVVRTPYSGLLAYPGPYSIYTDYLLYGLSTRNRIQYFIQIFDGVQNYRDSAQISWSWADPGSFVRVGPNLKTFFWSTLFVENAY